MKTTAMTAACALVMSAAVLAQSAIPKLFKSEDGRFQVTTPTELVPQKQTADTPVGKVEIHLFIGVLGEKSYLVSYNDYPQPIEAASVQQVLDGARDGMIANIKGKLIRETKVSVDGMSGREVTFEATQEGIVLSGRSRIFLHGQRLYQVMGLGAGKAAANDASIGSFIRSFKLLKK